MKTMISRILCAALLFLGWTINSQAGETAPAGGDAETVAAVRAAATSWADAWASKDVAAYLGHYASDFTPPDNLSRQVWEQQRRDRLARPAHISVELEWIGVVLHSDGTADATFTQNYKSPTYSDRVLKTMTLALENGQWKIRNERVGDAAAREAALKAEAERAAAAQEAALKAEAEREAAAKAAAEREAAERAAAQEAAMRAAAEEAARKAAEAYAAEQKAAEAKVAAPKETVQPPAVQQQPQQQPASAVKEAPPASAVREASPASAIKETTAVPVKETQAAVVAKEARIESGSGTWKIAGILLFLLLAPAVAYGTLVRPQQMTAA